MHQSFCRRFKTIVTPMWWDSICGTSHFSSRDIYSPLFSTPMWHKYDKNTVSFLFLLRAEWPFCSA